MRRHGKGTGLRDPINKSKIRSLAYRLVSSSSEMLATGIEMKLVRFDSIDEAAIVASEDWDGSFYPWADIPRWKAKDPKGFDLALWYDHELCGLCYATPRRSRLTIKIILLEGKPESDHPLKGLIAPLALLAVDFYARLLGCKEIAIQQPEPGAIEYYRALGFQLDSSGRLVISVGDS
jgi:hypothetical protein